MEIKENNGSGFPITIRDHSPDMYVVSGFINFQLMPDLLNILIQFSNSQQIFITPVYKDIATLKIGSAYSALLHIYRRDLERVRSRLEVLSGDDYGFSFERI